MQINIKKIANSLAVFSLIFIASLFVGAKAQAASLYVSPSAGSYQVGNTFQVGIFVSSADQAMNTAQAIISFPPDKLEVISVSTKNSIFSLMVENPSFTNNSGNINFSGIVLNPGYTGSSGRLVTISFKAKSVGQARVFIGSAQVLANDGSGSSILTSRGSATYNIIEKKVIEQPEVKPKPVVQAPVAQTPTPPTTTFINVMTTTVNIITSTICSTDHLPNIFLKINNVIFDQSALSLLLLLLMIAISATISLWGFVESFIHENKHHFKGKKFNFFKKNK